MIPEHALLEFKRLYKKRFGKELTDADTLDKATRLINMMRLVYKPMTKERKQARSVFH